MDWIVFKCCRTGTSESDKAYKKLSKKNKERIKEWLFEKSILSKSEKRQGNKKRTIIKFLTFVKKDYDKITYEDYINTAHSISQSKNGVYQKNSDREFIKRFLKDCFDDWAIKFKGLELFRTETKPESEKLKASDLLTNIEIDKMIFSTSNLKEKTLIVVLSVSGCRTEEALKLKWNDVDFQKNLIYLYSAKTKRKRAVPVGNGIDYLTRLKKETNAKENDLIFPSVSNKIMTNAGANHLLKRLGKKAGIKKYIYGYLFRHQRLSFLLQKLSPKVYEEISGHSLAMGLKTYSHLSDDEKIKEMNEKVFSVEKLTPKDKTEMEKGMEELQLQVRALQKYIIHGEGATLRDVTK